MSTQHTGLVKWFKNGDTPGEGGKGKGYGFIGRPGEPGLFVHITGIIGAGPKELFTGDQVSFEIGTGIDQRPRAVNVRVQLRAEKTERHQLAHHD